MPPVVIDLNKTEDREDAVHRAVQALAECQVVAVPTETVYGIAASALRAEGVEKLVHVKGRPEEKPLALAIKGMDEAQDYSPDWSATAQRLARRCWPGPLTLVVPARHPESLVQQLPPTVQKRVAPHGWVGLRVPANDTVRSILRLLPGPLALTSANLHGGTDAVTAQEVLQSLDSRVDLVLDEGRCRYAQPSTVVRVEGNTVEILREGVIGQAALRRLAGLVIVLVCTGNTCRSPMAEALLRARLAQLLDIPANALPDYGVTIVSAGIAAMEGAPASPEAVQIMKERGLDLSQHMSQPLSDRLVRMADIILTMTRAHRDAIVAHWPDSADRVQPLSPQQDVADPIGGPRESYQQCACQIEQLLDQWLDRTPVRDLLPQVKAKG